MNPKAETVRIKMLGNQHPKLFPHDDLLENKYHKTCGGIQVFSVLSCCHLVVLGLRKIQLS